MTRKPGFPVFSFASVTKTQYKKKMASNLLNAALPLKHAFIVDFKAPVLPHWHL